MSVNKKMIILIVDDAGAMRIMFAQMLDEIGFENILLAKDGLDAVNQLQEQRVDLIISDWNMPKMNGLELLRWIRGNEKYSDTPFIMATAQGDKTQVELVRKEKGNGHITKPFDSAQIKSVIDEVFGLGEEKKNKPQDRKVIKGKIQIKLAHIQITDHLILGVLKHQIQTGEVTPKFFELETLCMPGWNPVQESLEQGDVDGAFVLAPIAMDLFAFNVPIKLVSLAHKNGSSFVRNINYSKDDHESIEYYYENKVINIPHKMSIHNMLAHKYLSDLGLKPGVIGDKDANVYFEVVPPVKMPEIMKGDETVGGFLVAEPIASNSISKGISEMEFLSSTVWNNHPCCVVTMRDEFISDHSVAVYELVSLLVKAGRFIKENKHKAAEIAVSFLDPDKKLGLTIDVLLKVLQEPDGIKMDDLYPDREDLDEIQQYMHNNMGIGKLIDIGKFVDIRFIKKAIRM